jgi:alkaline phosphatase D
MTNYSLTALLTVQHRYNPVTGQGALGVEFAGTAVTSESPFLQVGGTTPATADGVSKLLISLNPDLQWSEGFYRGFFTLTIDPSELTATYYAMNNICK